MVELREKVLLSLDLLTQKIEKVEKESEQSGEIDPDLKNLVKKKA